MAEKLGKQLRCDQERVEVFAYGLQIILGTGLKLVLMLLIALILDTFHTTLICLITYIAFRNFGGGVHLSTYSKCLVTGLAVFTVLGKLAAHDIETGTLSLLLIVTSLLWIYAIIKWVPAGTEKKQVKDRHVRQKQKLKTGWVLMFWALDCMVLIRYRFIYHAFASQLGSLAALLLITPWGYRVANALDNKLDNLGKGGVRECIKR
ncbi:MAG: accessory gene regulator B family protein [Bacillota bacterium]